MTSNLGRRGSLPPASTTARSGATTSVVGSCVRGTSLSVQVALMSSPFAPAGKAIGRRKPPYWNSDRVLADFSRSAPHGCGLINERAANSGGDWSTQSNRSRKRALTNNSGRRGPPGRAHDVRLGRPGPLNSAAPASRGSPSVIRFRHRLLRPGRLRPGVPAFTGLTPILYVEVRRRFLREHPGRAMDSRPLPADF